MFLFARAELLERRRDVAGLLALFSDPRSPPYERAIAARAFLGLRDHLGDLRAAVVQALLRSAERDGTYVRRDALLALAELGAREALAAFRSAATDREWIIRFFAAHGFDRLADPTTVADVVGLLADDESQVREVAVAALASIGDLRARPHLETIARTDRYASVREAASDALAALG